MRMRFLISILLAFGAATGARAATVDYWNLFNIEGESGLTADYVTYATRDDMLTDTNRLGVFSPNGGGAGSNVVGSGSDGSTFWNLFNIEGESGLTADYVTYATLHDMLTDTNRLGVFSPNGGGAGRNVIGSGARIQATLPQVPLPAAGPFLLVAILSLAAVAGTGRTKRRWQPLGAIA